jgi:hypothetical protein
LSGVMLALIWIETSPAKTVWQYKENHIGSLYKHFYNNVERLPDSVLFYNILDGSPRSHAPITSAIAYVVSIILIPWFA